MDPVRLDEEDDDCSGERVAGPASIAPGDLDVSAPSNPKKRRRSSPVAISTDGDDPVAETDSDDGSSEPPAKRQKVSHAADHRTIATLDPPGPSKVKKGKVQKKEAESTEDQVKGESSPEDVDDAMAVDVDLDDDDIENSSDDDDDLDDMDDDDDDDVYVIAADDDDGNDDAFFQATRQADIRRSDGDAFQVVDVARLANDQQMKVMNVAETLNVPTGTAGVLLKFFNWDMEKLFGRFFEEKDRICRDAGVDLSRRDSVYSNLPAPAGTRLECLVCLEDRPKNKFVALPCEHYFCRGCWRKYVEVQVAGGYGCLMMTCPFRDCTLIVPEELVRYLLEDDSQSSVAAGSDEMDVENSSGNPEALNAYLRFVARSFVDDNPRIRWCPAPDCGRAICCPGMAQDNVVCACGQKFCFKCGSEAHEPSTCKELGLWKEKEKSESENVNWLKANAKMCPKCAKPIEKNGGCNHMTCAQCRYEFCWVCLDNWKDHDESTGGFYRCNRFTPQELEKKLDLKERNDAKSSLEKYLHYYERYANHARSEKFESQLLEKAEENMKKYQRLNRCSSWIDVEFIEKAVMQLMVCRNALKYTYIHAYYLTDVREKEMFEFMQEDLEKVTEKLSEILEGPVENFERAEILKLTHSAKTRMKNLLGGARSGLMTVY